MSVDKIAFCVREASAAASVREDQRTADVERMKWAMEKFEETFKPKGLLCSLKDVSYELSNGGRRVSYSLLVVCKPVDVETQAQPSTGKVNDYLSEVAKETGGEARTCYYNYVDRHFEVTIVYEGAQIKRAAQMRPAYGVAPSGRPKTRLLRSGVAKPKRYSPPNPKRARYLAQKRGVSFADDGDDEDDAASTSEDSASVSEANTRPYERPLYVAGPTIFDTIASSWRSLFKGKTDAGDKNAHTFDIYKDRPELFDDEGRFAY